jgi:hypothetical protein
VTRREIDALEELEQIALLEQQLAIHHRPECVVVAAYMSRSGSGWLVSVFLLVVLSGGQHRHDRRL